MIKILIIEDDLNISNMQKELLTGHGYEAVAAFSGTEGLLRTELEAFDLILLDLMLPGLSGEEVLLKLREKSMVPVICISAKDDVATRVALIKSGADDYLVKPFNNDELLVRIEAVLRRHNATAVPVNPQAVGYKDIELDTAGFSAKVAGKTVILTKRGYLILELLMKHPNKVFTKNNIYESVWGEEFYGDDNTVNVHISNIRQKLSQINPEESYIQTVWGIGFKMCE